MKTIFRDTAEEGYFVQFQNVYTGRWSDCGPGFVDLFDACACFFGAACGGRYDFFRVVHVRGAVVLDSQLVLGCL
jgi:hypothetical protein